jgi:hypothetical protein
VKLLRLVVVPPGAVTVMVPLVAPGGTVASISLSEATVKFGAGVWLKLTTVAPVRFFPLIATKVPAGPLLGEKLLMLGGGAGGAPTVKSDALVPVPAGVVTLIEPVVAPLGTVASTSLSDTTVKDVAAAWLKLTAVAPVKFFPLIATDVPAGPLLGEKLLIDGAPDGGAAVEPGKKVAAARTEARIGTTQTARVQRRLTTQSPSAQARWPPRVEPIRSSSRSGAQRARTPHSA